MKVLAGLGACLFCCSLSGQQRVVVDGDSLSSVCCPPYPAWPTLLTGFSRVDDFAISGGGVLAYPGCPHVISNTYDSQDGLLAPQTMHTNSFFVLHGSHNDIYAGRHTVSDTFQTTANLLKLARSQGYIAVGCTLAPSQLLSNAGSDPDRLAFNDLMRNATNTWDILMDWDAILPHDTSDTNWFTDGTHPGPLAVQALASAFQALAANYQMNLLEISRNGDSVMFTWPGYSMLQMAPSLHQAFVDTGIMIGPYSPPLDQAKGFFRLRLLP